MLHWLEPLVIIQTAGLISVLLIIFAESGLFFGFFLPGDSLLFTAGFLASQEMINLWILLGGGFAAAVLGDSVGYFFGRRLGPRIFTREDSFFFNRRHLTQTQNFYQRYGKKTIVLARFVPVVRTFAPILAGVGGMNYRTFFSYNLIGGAAWVIIFSCGGYFLGQMIPAAEHYLSLIVLGIIIFSVSPGLIHFWREKNRTSLKL